MKHQRKHFLLHALIVFNNWNETRTLFNKTGQYNIYTFSFLTLFVLKASSLTCFRFFNKR